MTDNAENKTGNEQAEDRKERTKALVHHLTRYFFFLSQKGAEEGASLDHLDSEELAELAAIGLEKGGQSRETFTTEELAKIAAAAIDTVRKMEQAGWRMEDYDRFLASQEKKNPAIPPGVVAIAAVLAVVALCCFLFSC